MKDSILYSIFAVLLLLAGQNNKLIAQKFDDKPHFNFNQSMINAYTNALHLRIHDSRLAIQSEKAQQPHNMMALFVENFTDFMQILADENPKEFEKMLANRANRISKIKGGDQESPYFIYTQAAIDIQWAWLYIKFNQPAEALKLLKTTSGDLERNMKYFPDFAGSKMLLGVSQVIKEMANPKPVTTVANQINIGIKNLQDVIQDNRNRKFEFNEEANFWYAMILLELDIEEEKPWNKLNANAINYQKNLYGNYILAKMNFALGQTLKAQSILNVAPSGEKYHKFPLIDYTKGLSYLYKFEAKADVFFKAFLDNYKGVHHIKEVYQRYAWSALLQNNTKEYERLIEGLLQNGNAVDPIDVWAEIEAKRKIIPNVDLLKVRLYMMSGVYDKAKEGADKITNLKGEEAGELMYYQARLLDKMKKPDDAIMLYNKVINASENKNKYVAALAYLHSAVIYMDMKENAKAKEAILSCLKTNPDIMKKSIHTRARMLLDVLEPVNTASAK